MIFRKYIDSIDVEKEAGMKEIVEEINKRITP